MQNDLEQNKSIENINDLLKERARNLRKNSTDAEKNLWRALRKKQINGIKFRRQYCIGFYIIDFVCLSHKLIIEVDGGHHQNQVEYDEIRTAFLNGLGFKVLRFWNDAVLTQLENVLEIIWNAILCTPTPALPRKRERESREVLY